MTAHNGRDVTSTVDELAARTPDTRDRYVDFLRAVSILAVVFGHWMIMIIWWQEPIRNTSAIGVTKGVRSGHGVPSYQPRPILIRLPPQTGRCHRQRR